MLGIITMAGNAFRAFGNMHPAIKWGVVVLAGLLAVEFVGREAISLYVAMQTAPAQIEKANADAQQSAMQAHALGQKPIDFTAGTNAPTVAEVRARMSCKDGGGTWDADAKACKAATAQDLKVQGEAEQAKAQGDAMRDCTPSPNYLKAVREARAAGTSIPSPLPCN